jgi:hypothetical protein
MARIENLGDTLIVMGETFPYPVLTVLNDNDDPIVADYDAALELFPAVGVSIIKNGVPDGLDEHWTFEWLPGETDEAIKYRSLLRLTPKTTAAPLAPMFGPTYQVYDPAALWADPTEVSALAGPDFSWTQIVQAILFAQIVVGAWVSASVQSPVPEPIRQAATLLAARALTTAAQGAGGIGAASSQIISETIADYTVRYADDGGAWIVGGIADLLDPYSGGRLASMRIGPSHPRRSLPITPDLVSFPDQWWWTWDQEGMTDA